MTPETDRMFHQTVREQPERRSIGDFAGGFWTGFLVGMIFMLAWLTIAVKVL